MQRTDLVFWHTPTNARVPSVIDGVMIDDQGTQRGLYSGETLEQLASRYTEPKVCDIADFMAMQESALRTQPEPSTEAHYTSALECLPPHDWRRVRGVESFKMVERLCGRMTRIYAKKGDSYWTFTDRDDLSAEDIAAKIEGAMQ